MRTSATNDRVTVWRAASALLITAVLLLTASGCGASASSTGSAPQASVPPISPGERAALFCVTGAQTAPPVLAQFLSKRPDAALCAASETIRQQALKAIRSLDPAQLDTLYRHLGRTGAASDEAAAALEISTGVLRAAAVRALPGAVQPSPADASRVLGPRAPNPRLAEIVQAAVENPKEPPCDPQPPEAPRSSSSLGEAGVQGALQALASGSSLQQTVGAALTEMFKAYFCDWLRRLIEAIKRAAKLLTDRALLDQITRDQAELERIPLPMTGSRPYKQMQARAVRAYVLRSAISELDQQSGGTVAASNSNLVIDLRGSGESSSRALFDAVAAGNAAVDEAPVR
jgi:hypothetical protein